ncbi:MAG TPA: 50S ribosomal protein L9 [Anaerolineales bacterium]|nr:50S ribosomal protein L9 [Anaerolineales bacterium]
MQGIGVDAVQPFWYNLPARSVVPFARACFMRAGLGAHIYAQSAKQKGLEMKVLLLKDVYKLGRAGDVKRVADGYGRNYLLPQELAVLATPGALKQVESIRAEATTRREVLNQEMSSVAERLNGALLAFPAKASETGKLYGSITTQMIAAAVSKKAGLEIPRRQIDTQPLRALGEHKVHIRLTVDLVPEVTVIVHREGEGLSVPDLATESSPVIADQAPEIPSAEDADQAETSEAEITAG